MIPTILVVLVPDQEGRMSYKPLLISGHHGNPYDFRISYSKILIYYQRIQWGMEVATSEEFPTNFERQKGDKGYWHVKYNREHAGPNPPTAAGGGNGGGVSLPIGGTRWKLANKAECGNEKYSKPEDYLEALEPNSSPRHLSTLLPHTRKHRAKQPEVVLIDNWLNYEGFYGGLEV